MNISLTIQKTIKRFIGKIVSKLTKPKKAIVPPPEPPEAPPARATTLPPKKPAVKKPRIQWLFLQKILARLRPIAFPQAKTQPQAIFVPPPPPASPGLMPALLAKLGKSAVGKAVKTGVKKIASWAATKLSLAAIPEPIISKALLILSLGVDALKLVGKGIKGIFGKIGGLFTGLLPIQAKRTTQKTADFAGNIVNKTALVTGAIIAGLTAVSLPAVLLLVSVGGALGAVGLTTVITVMTVGGAFQNGQGGGQIPNLGSPVVAQAPSSTTPLAEAVIWTLNQCGITNVNKNNWTQTENCLRASSLPNKETIIAQFHFSVYEVVGSGLQCVGFVRGIMAALGKDPGDGRDAKDYLNSPPPAGYQPANRDMSEVKIGDLAIMEGGDYGHIGLVIERNGNSIKIAQAWGKSNGLIQVTEINLTYFDGFLRPS